MNDTMNLLQEIMNITGSNITDLLLEYEIDHPKVKLEFKKIEKENDKIIIYVYDENSSCPFELELNEKTFKLEIKT